MGGGGEVGGEDQGGGRAHGLPRLVCQASALGPIVSLFPEQSVLPARVRAAAGIGRMGALAGPIQFFFSHLPDHHSDHTITSSPQTP